MTRPTSVKSKLAAILRSANNGEITDIARPEGILVWVHMPRGTGIGPVSELCRTIARRIEGATCLLTMPDPVDPSDCVSGILRPLPSEKNTDINAFLDHWQPDILLWGDEVFQTRVIQRGKARGLPMYLVNLPTLDLSRRFLRRSVAITLSHFRQALVTDKASANRLRELGYPAEKTRLMPPLSDVAPSLPDDELRRKSLVSAFEARAIWCAAFVQPDELGAVIAAHKQAQKSLPGLGLIVVPADNSPVDDVFDTLVAGGLAVQRPGKGRTIDRPCDVLLCEDSTDMGIWYRMATVTFIGGSFSGPDAADPFPAVALGSALICGNLIAPHQEKFRKLFMGGAVVSPDTAGQLGEVLIETLAPDRSAELAIAAWKVGSEGVEAVAEVVNMAISALATEAT